MNYEDQIRSDIYSLKSEVEGLKNELKKAIEDMNVRLDAYFDDLNAIGSQVDDLTDAMVNFIENDNEEQKDEDIDETN